MTGESDLPNHDAAEPVGLEALAAAVDRYADMVYSTCRRVLGSESEAADVAQETFFQFFQQADEITTSTGAWLHKVATCRALDVVRQNIARRRREEAYAAEHPRVPDSWAEVEPLVDEALDALPDDQRELLVLHFLERRTMTDLAWDYGVSQPTVSRMRRPRPQPRPARPPQSARAAEPRQCSRALPWPCSRL